MCNNCVWLWLCAYFCHGCAITFVSCCDLLVSIRPLKAALLAGLSLDVTKPECSFKLSYFQKWLGYQLLPFAAALLLFSGCVYIVVAQLCRRRLPLKAATAAHAVVAGVDSAGSKLSDAVNFFIGGLCVLLYYTYFVVLKSALGVFACTPDVNGRLRLRAEPSVYCWEEGSLQVQLVPYAVLSLLVYGCVYPALLAFALFRNKVGIRADQALWLRGDVVGGETRRRYGKLYQVRAPPPPPHTHTHT